MKNLVVSCVLCGAVAASAFAAPEAGSAAKRPPSESPAEGRAPAAAPTAEFLLAKAKEASGGAAWDRVATLHVRALLADLSKLVRVDRGRVFATGHSNGAAMAERLACELPGGIAGVASVAGGNQYSTTLPCTAPTPVLEIHGTDDPCWSWAGGPASCADKNPGSKIGVPATLEGWASRNGCAGIPTSAPVPDVADDGTTTTRYDYDCPQGRELGRRRRTHLA